MYIMKKTLLMMLLLLITRSNTYATTIQPYILKLNSNSATICWVTSEKVKGELILSSYSKKRTLTEKVKTYYHRIDIDNLTPHTRYKYEIGNIFEGVFTTASDDDYFQIAVFGHPAGTEVSNHYPVEFQAHTIFGLSPDFALCTGDITYYPTIPEYARHYFHRFEKFLASRPIYVSPGNHDASWPMLYGIKYKPFRTLFPYEYASKKGAYYSFVYKNTKFIALSYVLYKKEFKKMINWLLEEIDSSRSEFNIVYMGGAQEGHYDKQLLFDSLSGHRVALVFGGDGSSVYQENISDINYFFAGTRGPHPHEFYYLEFEKYRFKVKLFDSRGLRKDGYWIFNSNRRKKIVKPLLDKIDSPNNVHKPLEASFEAINCKSDQFDGLRLVINWPFDFTGRFRVRWAPESDKPLIGQGNFRPQAFLLRDKGKNEFTIPFPSSNPLTSEPYTLDEIHILFQPKPERIANQNYMLNTSIIEAYLFSDQ